MTGRDERFHASAIESVDGCTPGGGVARTAAPIAADGGAAPAGARRPAEVAQWKRLVAEFQVPSSWRATWQLASTLGAYVATWCLMYFALGVSWWLTLPLALLAGALLVRVFILFHDCGHGSFYRSRAANDFWGFVTGVLALTPYHHWRWEHALHHASAGHLDHRGVGDIWTLTVREYLESSRWRRFAYRLSRNPVVLFLLAPVFLFALLQRIPKPQAGPRERRSVWWTNLSLLALGLGLGSVFGFVPYLLLQLAVMAVAGTAGVWLFYVQHQFEGAYWEREEWDYTDAALRGSSFYKLPRVLQWFSGNIGFHHIHHLSPRIPNYNLERCHHSDPLFSGIQPLTLTSSRRLLTLGLWDEHAKQLIGFRRLAHVRARERASAAARPAGLDRSRLRA